MKGHRRSSTVVLGWRPPAALYVPSIRPSSDRRRLCCRPWLPDKQCMTACASEPLPKRTLMESVDVLAFYRRTVQTARFLKVVPAVFKEAFIIPLLKKPDLDSADPRS